MNSKWIDHLDPFRDDHLPSDWALGLPAILLLTEFDYLLALAYLLPRIEAKAIDIIYGTYFQLQPWLDYMRHLAPQPWI